MILILPAPTFMPLDFAVWVSLIQVVGATPAKSCQNLVDRIQEAWTAVLTSELVQKSSSDVWHRLHDVVSANGRQVE